MKRNIYPRHLLRAAALLLALTALLCACGEKTAKLTYQNGAFRSQADAPGFVTAPFCYKAAAMRAGTPAAVIHGLFEEDVRLYPLEGMDKSLWLGAEDYTLYCSENITLPTLGEMGITNIALCKSGAYTVTVGQITNAAMIADLVDIYEKGAFIPSNVSINARDMQGSITPDRYELIFTSQLFPGIAYSLEYWKYEGEMVIYEPLTAEGEIAGTYQGIKVEKQEVAGETVAVYSLGTGLVYDRFAGRFYAIGEILEGYLEA